MAAVKTIDFSTKPIFPEYGRYISTDGTWSYAYGAEDQLISVTSSALTNDAIRVLNSYDYRHRRTSKTVQRLYSTIAPPPSPPFGIEEWQTLETRTFVYDDWNLIQETIYTIDGGTTNTTEVQYFWGLDLPGTLQGAGGVGGLLAVSRNGQLYFPAYDNNGNVTKYIDESGNVVATYEYDDFGRTISQLGSLADFFRHRFSTKYYDSETDLYDYSLRFYVPNWRIWLNTDPIEEVGGLNLHSFIGNSPLTTIDAIGLVIHKTHDLDEAPPGGWPDSRDLGMAVATFRNPIVTSLRYKNGKVGFKVTFNPHETRIDIYFKRSAKIVTFMQEREHVDCYLPYDTALGVFKDEVEGIYACPKTATDLYDKAVKKLELAEKKCRKCNEELDKPGGKHGH